MTIPESKPRRELQPYEVTVPTSDGEKVAYVVSIMVPVEWDELARDWVLTPEAHVLIEDTKARHMGLLTPGEILALRKRWRLTQAQVAELLKIGAKTWTRWETGRQRPSQSMNLLLRALQHGMLTPAMLRQLSPPRAENAPALAATGGSAPGVLDLALPD